LANPLLVRAANEARQRVWEARLAGRKVGLVPTMGALHAGHLSLVQAARGECDFTVVTIFVNPTQFGPGEDFHRYPRDLAADLAALARGHVDMVFAPAVDDLYRVRHSTFVEPPRVARAWEGAFRPQHFRGVATIVLKLLHIIPADVAFFGHKDYQQTCVVRDMVDDFDIPVTIRTCPTIREADGLAMSSRNAYLSPSEREQAGAVHRSLAEAVAMFEAGERDSATIARAMRGVLMQAGIVRIDYIALVDPLTLDEVSRVGVDSVALVAVHVGATRLIDNTQVG
jgi:pantoate--beta-alanine ligase